MSLVPIVDLAPAHERGETRRHVAKRLGDAFATAGFAVVVHHGVPGELLAAVRRALHRAFALPVSVKHRYRAPALGTAGWLPLGAEANGYSFGEPTPPDLKESFVFSVADLPGDRGAVPNVWPAEVPELRESIVEYLAAVDGLHVELVRLLALALDLDEEHFARHAARTANTLNANWYPPLVRTGTPEQGQYRIGPHTDFGMITILDREPGLGGLQVHIDDERGWEDAPWVPGSLTVNCGDLLSLWSGGRWRSAVHRVLPPPVDAPDESLLSLVYFCETDADAEVAPLPGGPGSDRAPVRAGDYLAAKIAAITVG